MEQKQKNILDKLSRLNAWGTIHKTENTILHGFPKSEHGELKESLQELVKKGYVIKIPHHPDKKYYLNPKRKQEIYEVLGLL